MSGDSSMHNCSQYVALLEKENAELRAKLETANKIIDEYQQNIIPGFRERAEAAEKERDEVRRQIEELQKKNDELLAESGELVRANYILNGKYKRLEQAAQAVVDGAGEVSQIDNLAAVLAEIKEEE